MAFSSEDVLSKFQVIAAELLGVDAGSVSRESNLVEDFDADSLDLVEMSLNAQEAFGVTIPKEALPDLVTVGDAVDYVFTRLPEQA